MLRQTRVHACDVSVLNHDSKLQMAVEHKPRQVSIRNTTGDGLCLVYFQGRLQLAFNYVPVPSRATRKLEAPRFQHMPPSHKYGERMLLAIANHDHSGR